MVPRTQCQHRKGYLANEDLAVANIVERFFITVVLLRVLFAHALVAAPRLALAGLPRWLAQSAITRGHDRHLHVAVAYAARSLSSR